jgi:ADP-ribose pyrophosphatase YjhB (NUDIX family)
MMKTAESLQPQWLALARELQSIGQTGLAFNTTDYDIQRYRRLLEIAAEIIENYTQFPRAEAVENFRLQPGYATPKVDIRGAVVRDGKLLLVQERADNGWCMPGGWADVGETPSEAVTREVREESGFIVEPRRIIGVYDANRGGTPIEFYHAFKIVMFCDIIGGEACPSDETLAVDFFNPDTLPVLSPNRTHTRHISDVFEYVNNPSRPPVFD